MKKIKAVRLGENYSAYPTDAERIYDTKFNISKIEDPVEFKRLNNFIATVTTSNLFDSGCAKETLNRLRLKMNQLGFDFSAPSKMEENMTVKVPLRRFGGILGIDDKAQKLDNPYGPGAKFDIELSYTQGILSAKVLPAGAGSNPDTDIPM
jgi:hypothetical protein